MIVTKGHLGGYVKGGDDATYYPHMWSGLVKDLGVKTVLDVGCGEGHAIDYFDRIGAEAYGVDGIEQNRSDIAVHDYVLGPYFVKRPFDLVWCCEFVEHVQECYLRNFLITFACAPWVLMTHADPEQPGYHHVNCRTADYWIGAMAAEGYQHNLAFQCWARAMASSNTNPWNHFVRSGLAFVRNGFPAPFGKPQGSGLPSFQDFERNVGLGSVITPAHPTAL